MNNSKWRRNKQYRDWRSSVLNRDKKCDICSSTSDLQAHHLEHGSHNPELRYDIDNGVTLCKFHHTLFHCSYNNSYRVKCTNKDYLNFIELLAKLAEHQEYNGLPVIISH
jgi:predicted restriction endonuclease